MTSSRDDAPFGHGNDQDAMRVAFLFVGYRLRPFTVQVTSDSPSVSPRDISPLLNIAASDQDCGCPLLADRARDVGHAANLRFYAAIHPTSRRFLRLTDEETNVLINVGVHPCGDTSCWRLMTEASDITGIVTKKELAARSEGAPEAWIPREDEIHVLIALTVDPWECPPRLILTHRFIGERVKLKSAHNPRYYDSFFGSADDKIFHMQFNSAKQSSRRLPLRRTLLPVGPVPSDALLLSSFPVFDAMVITRTYCGMDLAHEHTPSVKRVKTIVRVPMLRQLSEEAAIRALVTANLPLYLDAVDCVVDVALYKDSVKVAERVVCYVKFEPLSDRGRKNLGCGLYVSPRMLQSLDDIVSFGDPSRLRLLLIIKSPFTGNRVVRVDRSCLPTAFPTVVTQFMIQQRVEQGPHWSRQ